MVPPGKMPEEPKEGGRLVPDEAAPEGTGEPKLHAGSQPPHGASYDDDSIDVRAPAYEEDEEIEVPAGAAAPPAPASVLDADAEDLDIEELDVDDDDDDIAIARSVTPPPTRMPPPPPPRARPSGEVSVPEPLASISDVESVNELDDVPDGSTIEARSVATSQQPEPEPAAEDAQDDAPDDAPDGSTTAVATADEPEEEQAPLLVTPSIPPAQLAHAGASQLPEPNVDAIEAVAAAVGRLRAEVGAVPDKGRKARLLYEAGEIQEHGDDEAGAARDYLAAYNADTSFREPLEGLVRVLERRRSLANLGKLIEALVSAAATPEERARALTQRAVFFEDVQKDLEGARGVAREATETGAVEADLGPAWLGLEMVAAKLGDAAEREEALAGRAELTDDPTWRGLLLVDAAELAAASGDVTRALDILARARREGGGTTPYVATVAVERIVRADPGLGDDAKTRALALAEALEARGELVTQALRTKDDATVPPHVRDRAYAIDAFVRAADAQRLSGDLGRAGTLLDRALALVAESPSKEEGASVVERVVLGARLRLAELAGDTELAASLADKCIDAENERDPGLAASLAMRIAEHAASEGDTERALAALAVATTRDPASAPARALTIDILEGSDDAERFARELESLSRQFTTGDAQGRTLLLAAFVWATRAESAARAREALGQAEASGVPRETVARLGRTLASIRSDHGWYEDATRALVEHLSAPPGEGDARRHEGELALLWIELARMRLAQGDSPGAAKATKALRELPAGAWLSRVLDGLAGADADPVQSRIALEELAASIEDVGLRRSLGLVAALRARAASDEQGARIHLDQLTESDPSDALAVAFLSDVLRRSGEHVIAAELAAKAAEAATVAHDEERAAARHLEAGLEMWRLDERAAAVGHFERAGALRPEAARAALAWSARGVDIDAIDGRRRALDLAEPDVATHLERFALEATGDDDAASSLAAVDASSSETLRVAAALGRLVWPRAVLDPDALLAALETVAVRGDGARAAMAAEHLRFTRADGAGDPAEISAAARGWLDSGGGAPAAVEWLASAMASIDATGEIPARRALADVVADEPGETLHASATLLAHAIHLAQDEDAPTLPLVAGSSHAARLANLELAPPGCEPRRRAAALSELNGALGTESESVAMGLAGWSALVAGESSAALDVFRAVTSARPDDIHAWEGLRASAEALGDHEAYAVACEQLGALCARDERGSAFWEQAALAWLRVGTAFEMRAEGALDAAFSRDPRRQSAFDRLFRRVRDRKDGDKLLDLAARRLEVATDAQEIAKLYWEQARVLREKGDPTSALEALEHVTRYDANHVGALALTGEIFIRRGMFAEAAEKLAHLASVETAPAKNRVTAGVAAVDLYENKLGRHDDALAVLLALHRARLTTLPVRERLARSAARTGAWADATRILEELMNERPEREGRIEAARLALAIYRDRLHTPPAALAAATKLLAESPGDGEAIDLVVGLDPTMRERRPLLERARDALLMLLHEQPQNLDAERRLARVAQSLGDNVLEHAALSCALALGGPDGASEQRIAHYASQKPRVPAVSLTEPMLRQLLAPGDDGPLADLFVALGPTLGEALGPTRESLGVTRRDRVDPRAALALRNEIAQWAGAFGITAFDLYVGGKDPNGVQGVAGDPPAIVVGPSVNAPLSPSVRGRLVRELLGIVRGTLVTRWRDDATIAAIAIAACNLAKIPVNAPAYPVLAEVERVIGKAIARKTRGMIEPICRAYVAANPDPRQWAARARASLARAAAVASGDASLVLLDVFNEPIERVAVMAHDDFRGHELLRFMLSRPYFDLRRALGLEGHA